MRTCLSLVAGAVLSLALSTSTSAVTIDWALIADPGNAPDSEVMACCDDSVGSTGYGSVPYLYRIAKHEVTNAQYVEFLNAVARDDRFDLYDSLMGNNGNGGILRSGSPGSYSYTVRSGGRENHPVTYVSFFDAARFSNWMHNKQPIYLGPVTSEQDDATTEDGAYDINGILVGDRRSDASIFLPTEDEWYKAAYYDAVEKIFFDYPTGSDIHPDCVVPTSDTGNAANCESVVPLPPPYGPSKGISEVGAYALSASPNGTFDQGGNGNEWNETVTLFIPWDAGEPSQVSSRGARGGYWYSTADGDQLSASIRGGTNPLSRFGGIRLASTVPEPSTALLVMAGVLGLAGWRRRRLH